MALSDGTVIHITRTVKFTRRAQVCQTYYPDIVVDVHELVSLHLRGLRKKDMPYFINGNVLRKTSLRVLDRQLYKINHSGEFRSHLKQLLPVGIVNNLFLSH